MPLVTCRNSNNIFIEVSLLESSNPLSSPYASDAFFGSESLAESVTCGFFSEPLTSATELIDSRRRLSFSIQGSSDGIYNKGSFPGSHEGLVTSVLQHS